MKKLSLLFSIPLITFTVIMLLTFSKKNQVQEKLDSLANVSQLFTESSSDLEMEKLFSNELNLVTRDLVDLSKRAKLQKKFWDELLNADLNIVINHSTQSSSSVNTEINKLLFFIK